MPTAPAVARVVGSASGHDRSARAGDRRQGPDRHVTHQAGPDLRVRHRRGDGNAGERGPGTRTAALLHDIGKLAVPEHILSKPGPLTQEEFQRMKIHPQVGAEILASVPFPYPVVPLVRYHHERLDGKGYPEGLSGQAIPLGARILAAVDFFDALTSERPLHTALTPESALDALQQEAGRRARPCSGRRAGASAVRPRGCGVAGRTDAPLLVRHRRPPVDAGRSIDRSAAEERVRGHRAGASRDLRALRDRAVDGHQPRRRRHDGAHRVEVEHPRSVLHLRAVSCTKNPATCCGAASPRASTPSCCSRWRS